MDRFARIVLGYHGCNTPKSMKFVQRLLSGKAQAADWTASTNDYDWLGHGIYFWEHSPERARQWAGENGSVIGALIQLGRCFDLTDVKYARMLRPAYENARDKYKEEKRALPKNEGKDSKIRNLDCLVINRLMEQMDEAFAGEAETYYYQTVRGSFEEGEPAFPGSMLKLETHIQIAVRDPACILGVFRPMI